MRITILLLMLACTATGFTLLASTESNSIPTSEFRGLGGLSAEFFYSSAIDVSADGQVVVGHSRSGHGLEAFRWTEATGMVEIGFDRATCVSPDGTVVGGFRQHENRVEPVLETGDGIEPLESDADYHFGAVNGMSSDGHLVVGVVSTVLRDGISRDEAFLWTDDIGLEILEPVGDDAVCTEALAVSANGEVVVGRCRSELGLWEAFRWTSATGLIRLGCLSGDSTSVAVDVSADGSVVVGHSGRLGNSAAFRWTEQDGMMSLGPLPKGCDDSAAFGVSGDGSIVVGRCTSHGQWRAFVWDAERGVRYVNEVLRHELDLSESTRGWKLLFATAVSDDGSVLVGSGVNPIGQREGWMARIQRVPTTSDSGSGPALLEAEGG